MLFLTSLEGIFSVVAMISVGYFLTRAGWLNEEISKTFSKLILYISLPCYMLYNITTGLDKNELETLSRGLIIPFASMLLNYLMAVGLSRLFHMAPERRGIFRSVFFASNTIFIGLPVNLALFGEKSVPYVLLYYIANTTLFWTIGAYEIGRGCSGKTVGFFSRDTLKRVVSPPLMGFVVGIVLILLNITLPSFVIDSCKYIGELTTPLAMFFIGIVIFSLGLRNVRFDRDTLLLLVGRFLVGPLTILILVHFFPVPRLMGQVFVIQSAMPAMTNTSVVARECGSDYRFAAVVTVVTTVASMLVIPAYMCLI